MSGSEPWRTACDPPVCSPDRVRRVLCLRSDNHAWRLVSERRIDFIQNAVAERVNQPRLVAVSAVLTPDLALDVQRGSIPGQPGAKGPKAMTNEGARWAKPARHCSSCRYRYPRRMTGRQFDRVWHHWRVPSQGFGAIARPLSVIAILSALVPVGVRSQPRWSLSRLDQIGSSPQLRDLGRDLAAFH